MDSSELIQSYFDLTPPQVDQINKLKPLYLDWNQKINVISRKNTDGFYTEHVLHSMSIASIIQFVPGTSVVDVGTGGGFPGIPLAILFPEVQFHLVDSIGKKITVVNEIVNALGLQNVSARQVRIEETSGSYDFAVSRAVTNMSTFYNWVRPLISPHSKNSLKNGIIYLKGGDLTEEMKALGKSYEEYALSEFEDPFFETKKVVYVPV